MVGASFRASPPHGFVQILRWIGDPIQRICDQSTVDLGSMAPIGYEICSDRNVQLPRANINLTMMVPDKIEIPPEAQHLGAKYVEFHPGHHVVDLYHDLHSPRLMHTGGEIAIEAGKPTIHFRLDAHQLPAGKYVLGISGDPFFAYCTLTLQ